MNNAGNWIGAMALGVSVLAAPVAAQEISDKAVKSFMDYAWSMTPAKFTKPDGKTVEVDKKNRPAVEVPQDVARDIIKAARLTAHAQTCNLPEEQVLNYRSLMKREENRKKWSDSQMIYINQLHLVTVMLLNGKLQLVETQEGKEPKIIEESQQKVATCTDEQAKKIKELITAYVKSGPPVTLPSGPLLGKVIEDAAKRAGQAAPASPAAPGAVAAPAAAPAAATPAKKP
jgi:hypothetical protein